MVGNQYLYFDSGVGWIDGYFQMDNPAAPTQFTFSNNDWNSNPVFPLSATYTGTVAPPFFTVGFYEGLSGLFAVAARLAYVPTGTTSTTTTYQVINYSKSTTAAFNPEDDFTMLFRYPEPGLPGATGPIGPQGLAGPTGAVGAVGSIGPTGAQGLAPAALGTASLRTTGGNQSISNNTPTAVTLDTVDIPTTNSGNLTTDTSTGLITCVTTGVYHVHGRINWSSTLLAGTYQLRLLVNGTETQTIGLGLGAAGTLGSQPTNGGQNITAYVNVTSANTTIGLQVNQNSGITQTLDGSGSGGSWLFVRRVE